MAKKWSRVLVGLICEETWAQNYVTEINKMNSWKKIKLKKYCPSLRRHTVHVSREKLK